MAVYRHVVNNHAPKCSVPNCINRVSYHRKGEKNNDYLSVRWKSCCSYHRSNPSGIAEKRKWMESRGCENADGHVTGIPCRHPENPSLTIDHKDGNRNNTDPSNIQVLCANCHQQKTKQNGDHQSTYSYEVPIANKDLFEFK